MRPFADREDVVVGLWVLALAAGSVGGLLIAVWLVIARLW